MAVSIRNPGAGGAAVAPVTQTEVDTPDTGGVAPVQNTGVTIPTGKPGPPGQDGEDGADAVGAIFEYQMPIPATVATIDHDLGHDPIAIQIVVGTGADQHLANEYGYFVTVPNQQIRISFDIQIAALVRLY